MNQLRTSLGRLGVRQSVIVLTLVAVIVSSLVLVIGHPLFRTPPTTSIANQNFVAGDVQVRWFNNSCKINVSVVASGDSGPGTSSGMITMAALPGCAGEMTARVDCLIVGGNRAVINGVIIQATGIFSDDPGVMGIVIENPAGHSGKLADQAIFQTSRPRDCPPVAEYLGAVPPVLEGGLRVHQAG